MLVTGSSLLQEPKSGDAIGSNTLHKFCGDVGKALAKHGHQLVLLSDAPQHVDLYVLHGYLSEPTRRGALPAVRVSYGSVTDTENRTALKFAPERQEFAGARFDDFNAEGDYPFNRVGIVRDVDVVVVIGGSDGAAQFVEISYALDKPIIPVPAFRGVAEMAWSKISRDQKRMWGRSTKALEHFYGDIYEGRGEEVVDLIERVVQLSRREAKITIPLLLGTEIVTLLAWFFMFTRGRDFAALAMPLLIVMMGVFGIVLRSLVRLFRDPMRDESARTFAIEIGLGVGLGVVYYLFFRLGGSSIAPDLDQSLKAGRFDSVALVVSVLALGASFMLEQAVAQASRRLAEVTETTHR